MRGESPGDRAAALATIGINIVGSALLGLITGLVLFASAPSTLALIVGTGFAVVSPPFDGKLRDRRIGSARREPVGSRQRARHVGRGNPGVRRGMWLAWLLHGL